MRKKKATEEEEGAEKNLQERAFQDPRSDQLYSDTKEKSVKQVLLGLVFLPYITNNDDYYEV